MALCDHEGTRGLAPLSILEQAPALFHHSIIPVWNMQNSWLGIPYYQQFVEFPIH